MKKGKSCVIASLLNLLPLVAIAQCFHSSQQLNRFDIDHNGSVDWKVNIVAFRDISFPSQTFPEYYLVRVDLDVGSTARVLRNETSGRIDFEDGNLILTNQPAYLSEPYHNLYLTLLQYRCNDLTPSEDIQGEFIGKRSAILGARFTNPDNGDVTLGWFKFSRTNTAPGTVFSLESWAYHPIPNEPIRAGFPPELPEPHFAFGGENHETIDVSWPAKAAMLRLETTDNLTPPVQWKPVETDGATTVTLAASEAQGAFFRLVAPEL